MVTIHGHLSSPLLALMGIPRITCGTLAARLSPGHMLEYPSRKLPWFDRASAGLHVNRTTVGTRTYRKGFAMDGTYHPLWRLRV